MSSRRRRPPGRPDGGAQGGHSGQQRWGTQWCQGRRVGEPVLSSLHPGGEAAGPGRREARRGSQDGESGGAQEGGAQEGGHTQLLLPCALLPSRKCRGLSPQAAGQASLRFWEPPPRRLKEQECTLALAQACLAPRCPTGGLTHPPRPGTAWGSSFLEEAVLGLAGSQTGGRPGARTRWGPR